MNKDQNSQQRKVHFIGIGGSGMLPLAKLALARGFLVSGSDLNPSSELELLSSKGAIICTQHTAENIKGCQAVIHSSAIKFDNPELQAARDQNLNILHRSEFLNQLCANHKVIAVAGTHGKTTTSALIAHILKQAGEDPTAVIGGKLINYDTNMLPGSGELAVIEADESDGSFLNYKPFIGVITNIDTDHLDFYKDLEGVINAFDGFIKKVNDEGQVVLNWDNEHCFNLREIESLKFLTFGTRIGSNVRLINYNYEKSNLIIDVIVERERKRIKSNLVGLHNVQNILCAITTCLAIEIPLEDIVKGVESFDGVEKRLIKLLERQDTNTILIDDYAHNPTKIEASLEAIAEAYPNHKIHAIFEPHRYSRLETMYNEIVSSFCPSTKVTVLPVFSAGEKPFDTFSLQQLAKDIGLHSHSSIEYFAQFPNANELFDNKDIRDTVFITLGAGLSHLLAKEIRDYLYDEKKNKTAVIT